MRKKCLKHQFICCANHLVSYHLDVRGRAPSRPPPVTFIGSIDDLALKSAMQGSTLVVVIVIIAILTALSLIVIDKGMVQVKRTAAIQNNVTLVNNAEEYVLNIENRINSLENSDQIEGMLDDKSITTSNYSDLRNVNDIPEIDWSSRDGTERFSVQFLGARPASGESRREAAVGESLITKRRYYRILSQSNDGSSARREVYGLYSFEKKSQ